ncbi:tripartite tricarboxylate transporter substrate binding protein [Ramlibacter sp. AW1]|uniref:Tripartite tricarboxylate transporter substrate binding protein n=1 Tax=Ramlibacter aurantiacus TaxID=2801330 RepID=A0A936ZFZ8_9BURK|nr:tripartite tricarboxylate transporter substrate binding protein [Ramlibacter aurantiacus]MBL0420789.1 tripartite tricarboxylate transporter substrate binding protein [Ramlibacter aurantiacus]
MRQNLPLTRRTLVQSAGLLALASFAPLRAWSQPVSRIVVPFPAGASNDAVGRLVADALGRKLGRSWIVENRPGAGSMLGTQAVVQSKPTDGNTLLLCATASMGILPAISKAVRYSVERDFTFIARIATTPFTLTVGNAFPANTFAEFVKLAKAKPDSIRIGASGVGSLDYMGAAMLQQQLGIDLNIIPYKGMSPVLNDLQGGHLDASIVSPGSIRALAQEGKAKVLAVLDERRSDLLPQVPTSTELGHPKLRVVNWFGIAGPAGMPADSTETLRRALGEILADPAFLKSLKDKGVEPAPLVGAEFASFVQADSQGWRALAQQANITTNE